MELVIEFSDPMIIAFRSFTKSGSKESPVIVLLPSQILVVNVSDFFDPPTIYKYSITYFCCFLKGSKWQCAENLRFVQVRRRQRRRQQQ